MKKVKIFQKVGKTNIIPISFKLVIVFICMILLSNLATNFITLRLSQGKVISLSNDIMVHQLKDIYTTASNQFSVSKYSGSREDAIKTMKDVSSSGFTEKNSIAFGISKSGEILFFACANPQFDLSQNPAIDNLSVLESLNSDMENGKNDGSLHFENHLGKYFGVYKYSEDWDVYIVRAELVQDTQKALYKTYSIISVIILVLTIIFLVIGLVMFNSILKNVRTITDSLYQMQKNQQMDLIDLSQSPNDDISYMAASFNSLSFTINSLMEIFKKFASKDVVNKAYRDHYIELAGKQRELTILFSDIRGFTYMTETLGNEIINLLNIHYDRVIHQIHERDGIIGSIIGDAILAVYGTVDPADFEGNVALDPNTKKGEFSTGNKSLDALESAWAITRVTAELRSIMIERRKEIEKTHTLTEAEERVYKAVLLDVGVGIDGGKVFYGNIGSVERMTNTVIGDNVNSASRLEGLTRFYSLPVIISEYVKNEVQKTTNKYVFYEIDIVQVKGKTEGKRIYLPLERALTDEKIMSQYDVFEEGLQSYYKGDWTAARKKFKESGIDLAKVFLDRIGTKQAPSDWSGIWTMTTK
ncbi:MAG: adenylate/guanylate cyclase domain-containing protein [Treponemataceae bacterium]|nr:adenylate/guanylate cyclase domain-containing protein [Spirochaetales bacterium]MDY6031852.1 adenylate/guanylate cyclase domain-containing protein [Treponemataceae bacterium]